MRSPEAAPVVVAEHRERAERRAQPRELVGDALGRDVAAQDLARVEVVAEQEVDVGLARR